MAIPKRKNIKKEDPASKNHRKSLSDAFDDWMDEEEFLVSEDNDLPHSVYIPDILVDEHNQFAALVKRIDWLQQEIFSKNVLLLEVNAAIKRENKTFTLDRPNAFDLQETLPKEIAKYQAELDENKRSLEELHASEDLYQLFLQNLVKHEEEINKKQQTLPKINSTITNLSIMLPNFIENYFLYLQDKSQKILNKIESANSKKLKNYQPTKSENSLLYKFQEVANLRDMLQTQANFSDMKNLIEDFLSDETRKEKLTEHRTQFGKLFKSVKKSEGQKFVESLELWLDKAKDLSPQPSKTPKLK